MRWRHVIVSTRRSWLHGDQRGFRSREHRVHSSGGYKNPPPLGEHGRLLAYHQKRSAGKKIKIKQALRGEVGLALLFAVVRSQYRVLVIAVTQKHAHLLVELPKSRKRLKQVVGKWKAARTTALRREMKGSIWGEGGKYLPVKTRSNLRAAYKYIRDDQGPGAWVWTFRKGVPPEVLTRLEQEAARAQKSRKASPKPRAQRSGAPDRTVQRRDTRDE